MLGQVLGACDAPQAARLAAAAVKRCVPGRAVRARGEDGQFVSCGAWSII